MFCLGDNSGAIPTDYNKKYQGSDEQREEPPALYRQYHDVLSL